MRWDNYSLRSCNEGITFKTQGKGGGDNYCTDEKMRGFLFAVQDTLKAYY